MGYRKLSARPRHHAQASGAIDAFKNVWPAPSARGFLRSTADQSASTYPASEIFSRPRWRYARSGPHKSLGVERRFLNQASRTPVDCQAISFVTLSQTPVDQSSPGARSPVSTPPLASSWRQTAKHRPSDPCQLVGQGDDCDVEMGPHHQRFSPSTQWRVAVRLVGQRLWLPASGELPRNQTEPRGQIATMFEAFCVADRGHERRCNDRADTGIVVSRREASFSFAHLTNSASKAAIRRSSSAHCARASATSRIIRGLTPAFRT